jgi:hypothetical protein
VRVKGRNQGVQELTGLLLVVDPFVSTVNGMKLSCPGRHTAGCQAGHDDCLVEDPSGAVLVLVDLKSLRAPLVLTYAGRERVPVRTPVCRVRTRVCMYVVAETGLL